MNKDQIRVGDILRANWDSGVYKVKCLNTIPGDSETIFAEILHPPQRLEWRRTYATVKTLSPWSWPCPMEVKQ